MKPNRNAPCPCGSTKKYKRCCGAPGVRSEETPVLRGCDGCTACCDGWVKIQVHGHAVYPGCPCPYSTGHGCTIYAQRPPICREFLCAWRAPGSWLPQWFRPDEVGCIVLPAKLSWRGMAVDVAVPVGRRIKPRALAWLKRYAREQGRALIYGEGEEVWAAFGPAEFQQEIARRIQGGEALW